MLILFSERDKLPKWSSCSGDYDTIEDLLREEEIPEWKCSKCGGLVRLAFRNRAILEEHKMCFDCNCFREVCNIAKVDKNRMIIDGASWHVRPDAPGEYFQGMGGAEFRIKRFDSEEIITTRNLWHQGDIPEIWKEEIKNNAEFIRE